MIASPKKNLTARIEEQTAKKLKEYKDSPSKEEIETLVRQTKELKEYQDTPSPKEDLEKIPMLTREEIGREPAKLIFEETNLDSITVVRHDVYIRDRLSEGPLQHGPDSDGGPAVSRTLKICPWICGYEKLQLQRFEQRDLFKQRWCFLLRDLLSGSHESGSFTGVFVCSARVLYEKLDFGFEILEEIINRSVLDDEKRLNEI